MSRRRDLARGSVYGDQMSPPSDDELARTATAGGTKPASVAPAKIGRFTVVGVLGSGGMGIVHEARDPELDRRVALKVLHASDSADARTRLLREARAMAKLSHPNVITVYEVGTDGGRDYIAMELIEGGSLADWLDRKPSEREILVAFIAAGRGLAAAHAAGIVHRDFKPHNVLRRRDGNVVVTDFGLAYAEAVTALSVVSGALAVSKTMTAGLMGTPAYMAPEQWRSEPVTPATDQFAFCAALWEALAGERPFRGATIDALRDAILDGPSKLDDAAIPRALRPLLRRGLALDPAKRWPSLDALLGQLERALHRRRRMLVTGGIVAAVAVAAVAIVVARDTAPRVGDGCAAPSLDPTAVTKAIHGRPLLGAALADWNNVRGAACQAAPAARSQQLACLDAVLARIADASNGSNDDGDELAAELVEPALCQRPNPPKLVNPIDGDLAAAFAARRAVAGERPTGELARLIASPAPCTRAVALLSKISGIHDIDPTELAAGLANSEAMTAAAERCGDAAIVADAQLSDASGKLGELGRAEAAVEAFPSASAQAGLALLHAEVAAFAQRIDEAIAQSDQAIALLQPLHADRAILEIVVSEAGDRLERSTAADLAAVAGLPERWKAAMAKSPRNAVKLAADAGGARWRSGDVAGGDAEVVTGGAPDFSKYIDAQLDALLPTIDAAGIVVDEHGTPVGGAEVAAAPVLQSDREHVASQVLAPSAARTTSDAQGRFALRARGYIAAKSGDRWSAAVKAGADVRLVLLATNEITGTVHVHDTPPGLAVVIARYDQHRLLFSPVLPGGGFTIAGVPRGTVELAVFSSSDLWAAVMGKSGDTSQFTKVKVDASRVTGVTLELSSRRLTVIARSATESVPETAFAFVYKGKHTVAHATLGAMDKVAGMFASMAMATPAGPTAKPPIAPDDLVAEVKSPPAGDLTICAVGFTRRSLAAAGTPEKIRAMMLDAEAGCATVGPEATTVTVEVPGVRKAH